jgi:hypothetical protein
MNEKFPILLFLRVEFVLQLQVCHYVEQGIQLSR